MRTLRLIVEYDGTGFSGWQRQLDKRTVQQTLEEGIAHLMHEEVRVEAAGRTDTGVHAEGQVVSFRVENPLPLRTVLRGLNAHLPRDMCIRSAEEVPHGFSARFHSQWKHYRYRVWSAENREALMRSRRWWVPYVLDLEEMRAAAAQLTGEQDYESFRSASCDAAHAVRNIMALRVDATAEPARSGVAYELHFVADAFCRNMVRIMTGTLVDIGRGRFTAASVSTMLAARSRQTTGVTAPPHGLTLVRVGYGDDVPPL